MLSTVSQTMLRNPRGVQNFVCPRCAREGEGGDDDGGYEGPELVVVGSMLELKQRGLRWFGHVKRAEGVCWMRWGR